MLKPKYLEPGPIKVVAIDTGSGLVHLSPEDGGIVVGMVLPTLSGSDITVNDDESVHIYQSTKQFQITGSGSRDNTKASGGINFDVNSCVIFLIPLHPQARRLDTCQASCTRCVSKLVPSML